MNKNIKRFSVLLIAVMCICVLATSLVACNDNSKKPTPNPNDQDHTGQKIYDSETRAFSMSISTPDGVFNPFFSSSAYDSSIISLTQISMLSTDKDGKIVCGENEPTVVKDYRKIEKTNSNDEVESTVYEFLIKKGIKWPNGSELTIKDVLFNLYVYLDPAYTGSATIYSTNIKGLKQYRQQTENEGSDDSAAAFEAIFAGNAVLRRNALIGYVKYFGKGLSTADKEEFKPADDVDTAQIALDFVTLARLFREELNSDWNAINVEDYKDWGRLDPETEELEDKDKKYIGFDEKWQIFLFSDGNYTDLLKKDPEGNYLRNDKDNLIMDEDQANDYLYDIGVALEEKGLAEIDSEIDSNDKVTFTGDKDAVEAAIKEYCIDLVFGGTFNALLKDEYKNMLTRKDDEFKLSADEQKAVLNNIIKSMKGSDFEVVARYWGSATTLLENFKAEAKSNYFKKFGSNRVTPNISGITTKKVSSFAGDCKNVNGKLDGEYDVLCIEIDKVDPKAIYNFAFTVAPMYYYSTTNWNGKNYIKAMADDYAKYEAATAKGEFYPMTEFGLEFGDIKFLNQVVNAQSKIGVPVGGGSYMASSATGKESGVKGSEFLNNNMVYYVRNPYFYTVGAQLENAKIKYVRCKVVESDQIVNSLINGDIDFGDPSATQPNKNAVKNAGLQALQVDTNGYGYVGINPKYVPNLTVRRIIMRAMNRELIVEDYYEGGLAELIQRPMSMTSWAYPHEAKDYESRSGFSYKYSESIADIKGLLEDEGYVRGAGGVYEKDIPGFGKDRLDYKFTIAGGSNDHPAYKMFLDAVDLLNSTKMFNVRVTNDLDALSKLSSGNLEVWAAAWSSTIDPDMYQVYHMESQASSVKNWGYPQILGGTCPEAYADQLLLIEELSELIDEGRATTNEDARKETYADALDVIMELAVELPTYQRKDMSAYQSNLLNPKTLPSEKECSPYSGLLARIWEIDYL